MYFLGHLGKPPCVLVHHHPRAARRMAPTNFSVSSYKFISWKPSGCVCLGLITINYSIPSDYCTVKYTRFRKCCMKVNYSAIKGLNDVVRNCNSSVYLEWSKWLSRKRIETHNPRLHTLLLLQSLHPLYNLARGSHAASHSSPRLLPMNLSPPHRPCHHNSTHQQVSLPSHWLHSFR